MTNNEQRDIQRHANQTTKEFSKIYQQLKKAHAKKLKALKAVNKDLTK